MLCVYFRWDSPSSRNRPTGHDVRWSQTNFECRRYWRSWCYSGDCNTLGIRKPDMSGFRMVERRMDHKWSGFRIVKNSIQNFARLDRLINNHIFALFIKTSRLIFNIWKLEYFVRYWNLTSKMSGFGMIPDFVGYPLLLNTLGAIYKLRN